MYRFLFTPRWLGLLALILVAAAVMVMLGDWQYGRYQERSEVNKRIDANSEAAPVPIAQVMPAPDGSPGTAGPTPPASAEYTPVTVTGRYDTENVILVRGRTVSSRVGFEVLTPLVLTDGTAVLVDQGWVPPGKGGARAAPELPALPPGDVTVTGLLRLPEGGGEVSRRDGQLETRRIEVAKIARELPYPVHGGYLMLTEQDPPADPAFAPVPIRHENNWQNGIYAFQWWLFALMAVVGFGYLAYREAHATDTPRKQPASATLPS